MNVKSSQMLMKPFNHRYLLQNLLPQLRDELASALNKDLKGDEAAISRNRICKLFDYTMADGKFARSCLAMKTFMVYLFGLNKY
jgi:hypothetical protein